MGHRERLPQVYRDKTKILLENLIELWRNEKKEKQQNNSIFHYFLTHPLRISKK